MIAAGSTEITSVTAVDLAGSRPFGATVVARALTCQETAPWRRDNTDRISSSPRDNTDGSSYASVPGVGSGNGVARWFCV